MIRGDMTRALQLARPCVVAVAIAIACLACVSKGPADPVRAPTPVAIDTRLRVELATAPSRFARRRPTLVGTLAGRDSSSIDLRVRRGDPPIHIPLAAVGATYTSLGPRSRARAATVGALRSGAVGLVSGLIMAAFVSSGDASGTGVVIGRTAFGAALGAGIGIVAPGERWRRVRMCESSASAPGR